MVKTCLVPWATTATPGGLTSVGVTKKTWDGYCGDDIDEERMKNITVDDIKPIYRTNY